MDTEKLLTTLHLKPKEAKLYLTSLRLGAASVYELALKSDLKRPTTYLLVEELMKKGYLKLIRRHHKNYYAAVNPKKIKTEWKNKLEMIESLIPELEKISHESKIKPRVEFYEGIDGLKKIYTELDPDIYHSEEICWFGSIAEGLSDIFPERLNHWLKVVHDKRVYVRELMDQTSANLKFFNQIKTFNLPHYQIRYAPKNFFFGPVDVALFHDSVYIMSLMRDIFAIKITSEQVKKAFQFIYELAWQQAEDINPK